MQKKAIGKQGREPASQATARHNASRPANKVAGGARRVSAKERAICLEQKRLFKRLRDCHVFITECTTKTLEQLAAGEPFGLEVNCLRMLMNWLPGDVRRVVEAGDVFTARDLRNVVGEYEKARAVFGPKVEFGSVKRWTIELLLKEHSAKEWVEVFAAQAALDGLGRLDGINTTRNYQVVPPGFDPQKLRREPDAALVNWFRNSGAAQCAEALLIRRGIEGAEINTFVALLQQGWFWNRGPWVPCPWKNAKRVPPREDAAAWMKLVMPFLKELTKGDARQLRHLEGLLASRKQVHAGTRLADDKPEYAWNQIEGRIKKAWKVMCKRGPRKPVSAGKA
jgi:hypothetical protein